MPYDLRVSRSDAIAICNRGGDYVVHAGQREDLGGGHSVVHTACGRELWFPVEQAPETGVTCQRCNTGARARRRRNI